MKTHFVLCFVLASAAARGEEPTAAQILAKYDEIMGPQSFESVTEMTAHREDGTTRTYKMKVLKNGSEKFKFNRRRYSCPRRRGCLRP